MLPQLRCAETLLSYLVNARAGGFSVAQIRALYAAAVRRLELESAAGHASRRGEAGAVAAEVADLGTWVEWEVARLGRLLGASPADRGEERKAAAADGGGAASDDAAAATMLKAHRALARWAGA